MRHAGLLYRLALRLTGHAEDAEDVVQETLVRAHKAFHRFELHEYGARPWLLKILHRVFFTRRLRQSRQPQPLRDLRPDELAASTPPEPLAIPANGQLDWDGFDQELKTAVERLPVEYRSVLLLWALGDLAYREIADILDCPVGTVMSRLYRARQLLGQSLADYAARRGIRVSVAPPEQQGPSS